MHPSCVCCEQSQAEPPVSQTLCWSWTKICDQYPGLFAGLCTPPPELAETRCSATHLVHSKKCTPSSGEASPGRISQNGVSGSHIQSRPVDTVVCWHGCHAIKVSICLHMCWLSMTKWKCVEGDTPFAKGWLHTRLTSWCYGIQQGWCQ